VWTRIVLRYLSLDKNAAISMSAMPLAAGLRNISWYSAIIHVSM
jgi:hypothetical protein